MSDLADHDARAGEGVKVERWRLKILLDAGYELADAERLAARVDVDLHRAVALRAAGCPSRLAADILA